MTLEAVRYWLNQLSTRQKLVLLLQTLLKGIGFGVLFFALAQTFTISFTGSLILASVFTILFVVVSLLLSKIWVINNNYISRSLNQLYPQLQNSTDLILSETQHLSTLQQIQQLRVIELLTAHKETLKLPNDLMKSSGLFLLCVMSAVLLLWNQHSVENSTQPGIEQNNAALVNSSLTAPSIESIQITISPPVYTQIKPYSSPLHNIVIPEGSVINYQLRFNQKVQAASIILSGKDSLQLKSKEGQVFEISFMMKQDAYFQLAWKNENWQQSDLYAIRVTKDNSPVLNIINLQQFTELTWEDSPQVTLLASLQDDYSISKGQIIATVSKGSGESVKFREEKINFTSPTSIQGKNIKAEALLNLRKLGLEPGDELYFYIEAFDNKTIPNRSRTDTYFIAIQDTSEIITSTEEGLGVDLMPEYFRSQRQIIIDTEKLIRNKKALSLADFKATSNELGYDQKVLRLRYSEFMGEEFVSGIGPQVDPEDIEATDEQDVVKAFGHVHDSENEHNHVEHKHEEEHDHKHEESTDRDKKLSPLEEFVHAHDDAEEATFYIQSVKAKLRAALTLMWDAELQLRLFEPTKSLPYQYKILKLLKEISNDSRIYVHRTGFDPPPIKEDKRYSADLSEVTNPIKQSQLRQQNAYAAIQQALTLLQAKKNITTKIFTPKELQLLQMAGNEMAALSQDNPIVYLEGLQGLSKLINGHYTKEELSQIINATEKALWKVMPNSLQQSTRKQIVQHTLDSDFIKVLEQQKND